MQRVRSLSRHMHPCTARGPPGLCSWNLKSPRPWRPLWLWAVAAVKPLRTVSPSFPHECGGGSALPGPSSKHRRRRWLMPISQPPTPSFHPVCCVPCVLLIIAIIGAISASSNPFVSLLPAHRLLLSSLLLFFLAFCHVHVTLDCFPTPCRSKSIAALGGPPMFCPVSQRPICQRT